jgi:sialic acid synthase SpsE
VFADEILHPNTGEITLVQGKVRIYDRFKEIEKPFEFYQKAKEHIEALGLLFLCTPFGLKSLNLLSKLSPRAVKIASPELNFHSLLMEAHKLNVPLLLSSGVSSLSDIESALSVFKDSYKENKIFSENICLLHCVTSYPAPPEDYNLKVIKNLSNIFGVCTGVSDHSSDPCLVPALSVSQGALCIEKHFCLCKNDPGLDDPIALEPRDFARMVRSVKKAAKEGPVNTIEELCCEYSRETVLSVLGNGVKTLAQSELENYSRTNRSIHALHDIPKGHVIKKSDFAILRTEKILRPGLAPCFEEMILGRAARNFIQAGQGIRFEDI